MWAKCGKISLFYLKILDVTGFFAYITSCRPFNILLPTFALQTTFLPVASRHFGVFYCPPLPVFEQAKTGKNFALCGQFVGKTKSPAAVFPHIGGSLFMGDFNVPYLEIAATIKKFTICSQYVRLCNTTNNGNMKITTGNNGKLSRGGNKR